MGLSNAERQERWRQRRQQQINQRVAELEQKIAELHERLKANGAMIAELLQGRDRYKHKKKEPAARRSTAEDWAAMKRATKAAKKRKRPRQARQSQPKQLRT